MLTCLTTVQQAFNLWILSRAGNLFFSCFIRRWTKFLMFITVHLILISKFCAFYTVSTGESFSLAAGDGFPPYILMTWCLITDRSNFSFTCTCSNNPYPTAFPYGNGMVLHFYQQQESSTTKTVHKVINKGLKTYV